MTERTPEQQAYAELSITVGITAEQAKLLHEGGLGTGDMFNLAFLHLGEQIERNTTEESHPGDLCAVTGFDLRALGAPEGVPHVRFALRYSEKPWTDDDHAPALYVDADHFFGDLTDSHIIVQQENQ